jgi:aminoglycoside phosphotransferase (APT) family kinase protein
MTLPLDRELAALFRALGLTPESLLGSGGEAHVFALDAARVARVYHPDSALADVAARTGLLTALARQSAHLTFGLPQVLDTCVQGGRIVTIERRFAGRTLAQVLADTALLDPRARPRRDGLVRAFLTAVAELATLRLTLPFRGEVCREQGIRTPDFRSYLVARAQQSLAQAGAVFASVSAQALADALPVSDEPYLVHLDTFAGNVLIGDDDRVTAVLDFGAMTACGDARLDAVASVVYLAPEITPAADDADRHTARLWLEQAGLSAWLTPVERWLAALWSFVDDDPAVRRWCRRVLLA